jgi:hypothetical protein
MRDLFPSWIVKIFMALVITEVALSVAANLLRRVTTGELLITIGLLSTSAYFIRERRRPRDKKPRTTSSGERTPVMPRRKS